MKDLQNREAQFRTVVSLILENQEYQFEGIAKGRIIQAPIGTKGFGYDPIFVPEGYNKTFAELEAVEKNNISHRGKAIQKLVEFLKNY